MTEALLGALGMCLLYLFFKAVEVRWPESYYGVSELISYQVSLKLGRYLTFRFLPVIVVGFLVSSIAISLHANGLIAGLTTAALHGVSTAGRAAFNAARRHGVFARRLLLAAHVGVMGSVLAAGWVGGRLGYVASLRALVPEPVELRGNLWTALLAGVVGAYLVRATQTVETEPEDLARSSARTVGADLLRLAEESALLHGTDSNLVKAIMLVENLQRPRWIRALERVLGRVFHVGTYGVMQVRSDRPLSDEESVQLATSTKLAGLRVPTATFGDSTYPDANKLRKIIASYNGNARFVDLVVSMYFVLEAQEMER